jgi:hypothetical protein
MKLITTVHYLDTFHRAIPRNLILELCFDEFEHLSSQNHESIAFQSSFRNLLNKNVKQIKN